MKFKITIWIWTILGLLVFAGCNRTLSPKEAVEGVEPEDLLELSRLAYKEYLNSVEYSEGNMEKFIGLKGNKDKRDSIGCNEAIEICKSFNNYSLDPTESNVITVPLSQLIHSIKPFIKDSLKIVAGNSSQTYTYKDFINLNDSNFLLLMFARPNKQNTVVLFPAKFNKKLTDSNERHALDNYTRFPDSKADKYIGQTWIKLDRYSSSTKPLILKQDSITNHFFKPAPKP